MITLIFFILLGIFISYYLTRKNFDSAWMDFSEYLFNGMFGCIFGLVVGFIVGFSIPTEKTTVTDIYQLESISDNSGIAGSFFLGSGNIDGVMKYSYYLKSGDEYYLRQTNVNNSVIKYSNTKTILEVKRVEETDYWLNYFSLSIKEQYPKYIFYIPKGSIKNQYNLDSE